METAYTPIPPARPNSSPNFHLASGKSFHNSAASINRDRSGSVASNPGTTSPSRCTITGATFDGSRGIGGSVQGIDAPREANGAGGSGTPFRVSYVDFLPRCAGRGASSAPRTTSDLSEYHSRKLF